MVKMGKVCLLMGAVVLLAACPDGNLLMPGAGEEGEVLIQSVPAGSVVERGEEIDLSLVYPPDGDRSESAADRVRIILERNGRRISDDSIPAEQIRDGSVRSIRLPDDIDPGLYRLRFSVERGADVISRSEVPLFSVTERYRIRSVSSYPPALNPGSSGTLQAHLDVPDGSDPYLRWRMGRTLVAEGLLSGGLSRTMFQAPASEGVFPVSLEIFPEGPERGEAFDFTSPIRSEINLFVSSTITAASHELSGSDQYYSLLNLRGDRVDRGARKGAGKDAVVLAGEPRPTLEEGSALLGYRLSGSNGLQVNDILLPSRSGRLEPFSLILRMEPQEGRQSGRSLVSMITDGGEFLLRVSFADDGGFGAILFDGDGRIESRSEPAAVEAGEPATLILSVIPHGGEVSFLWSLNGLPIGTERVAGVTAEIPDSGSSTIGGENGFRGIVDEFGIYYRDGSGRPAVYADSYLDAMRERYGADLIFADGFEGIRLRDTISRAGGVSLVTGHLSLAPGGTVRFPPITVNEEVVVVRMASGRAGDGLLSIAGAAGDRPILQVRLDGASANVRGGVQTTSVAQGDVLELRIMHRGDRLFLDAGTGNPDPLGPWSGEDLELSVENPPSGSPYAMVDAICIHRESLP